MGSPALSRPLHQIQLGLACGLKRYWKDRLLEGVVAVVLDVNGQVARCCAFQREGELLDGSKRSSVRFGKRDCLRGRMDAVSEWFWLLGCPYEFLRVGGRQAALEATELLSQ